MPIEGLYTVREAAALLGLTPGSVRNAISRRALGDAQSAPERNFIAAAEIDRYRREVRGGQGWTTRKETAARAPLRWSSEERPRPTPQEGETAAPPLLSPWPALRVQTLGLFAVWRGAEPVPPTAFAQRKVALLFTLLLQAPGLRLPREHLAEALWPEAAPEQAAARVRGAVHRLRQVLGAPYLQSVGELLVLDPAPGQDAPPPDWCDALAFERAAQGTLTGDDLAAARAALGLYGGAYLPEERVEGGARARRTPLRATYHALLLHTAALAQWEGHPAEAERLLTMVLEEEPAHEEAALAVMRLLAGQGGASRGERSGVSGREAGWRPCSMSHVATGQRTVL